MRKLLNLLSILIALVFISSCGTPEPRRDISDAPSMDAEEVARSIKERFLDLDAVRELKSAGKEGADFVSDIYRKAGRSIPRTTEDLARHGRRVKRESTRIGDLVFFRTGFFKKHVGVYLGMNRFVHSTEDEGVMVSNIKDTYWKKTYWQSRRILEFQ